MLSTSGLAQTVATSIDTENALREMFRLAGVIFAGQVVALHRHEGTDAAPGVLEVDFAVEDAIRGVSGGSYTLRELASLGSLSAPPFCIGQRYLMMLHTASVGGLSSPVGGMDGAIPIRGSNDASPLTHFPVGAVRISGKQADGRIVDLRWVAARVERPVSYRVSAFPSRSPVIGHPLTQQNSTQMSAQPASPAEDAATIPEDLAGSRSVPYPSLIMTLRSWAKADNAVR